MRNVKSSSVEEALSRHARKALVGLLSASPTVRGAKLARMSSVRRSLGGGDVAVKCRECRERGAGVSAMAVSLQELELETGQSIVEAWSRILGTSLRDGQQW